MTDGTYLVHGDDGVIESVWPSAAQAIRAAKAAGVDVLLHDDAFEGEHDDTSRSCPCRPELVHQGGRK